jgi:hypothetical protein
MKKNVMQLSLIAFFAISLSSCKKTYECHCVKKGGGEDHVEVKATKSDAEHECHELAEGSTVYSDCHLE